MVLSRLGPALKSCSRWKSPSLNLGGIRTGTSSRSGGVLPEPHKTSFGLLRIVLTVVPGLLIGAAISKNIANFLEENDLFVPSDDDDDDD
ncbi:hypothetical protein Zmor_025558 [Zophobas morio]|uniref:Essential MCU regulator, mitochondrial n=1 Tax=Zophobas morio TaxID=2755281 RepID=A0AA38HRU2_9CUCU|nr:hypothetical protein Zmor_025558 [Zophobas morio]